MDRHQAAARIDHTLLAPDAGPADIERLCAEAVEHGFYAVCVNPWLLPLAVRLLAGHAPRPITVAGFPLGANLGVSKAEETARAVALGAAEVDMVLNVGAFKAGQHGLAREEIASVVEAAGAAPVKVIIETCLLTDEEKAVACGMVAQAGAAFVKTSTGFSRGGATEADLRLLRAAAPPALRIKASGGIRTARDARAMIEAGADRLGTSASVAILRDWDLLSEPA